MILKGEAGVTYRELKQYMALAMKDPVWSPYTRDVEDANSVPKLVDIALRAGVPLEHLALKRNITFVR